MIPYPWNREHTFEPRTRWSARASRTLGPVCTVLAILFSGPIAPIVGVLLARRWTRTNAAPRTYATLMLAAGVALAALFSLLYGGLWSILIGIVAPALIVAIVWWTPRADTDSMPRIPLIAAAILFAGTALWTITGAFSGINTHAFSLTAPFARVANASEFFRELPTMWLYLFPYGLIIGSITLYWWCTARDYATQKYLDERRPTRIAHARYRRNVAHYTDHQPDNALVPALVVDDKLPWRQDRYGVPVTFPLTPELGHGIVLGMNGSGKTVFALTVTDQIVRKGWVSLYLDFKGDLGNRDKLAALADDNDAPFYAFDIRLASHADGGDCFFDPLDFDGDPAEKAALVSGSFAEETTDEAYYRTAADSWLKLQFAILQQTGLDDGEGTFDFLLSTASVTAAKQRIASLQNTDPGIYTALAADIDTMDDKRLEGLRTNLGNIVNTPAGARMHRPTAQEHASGARYIDLRALSGTRAVVYFGLGIGGQKNVARMLGALVAHSLSAFVDYRNSDPSIVRDDYFVTLDEFGLLEHYTAMLGHLTTNARSVRVWIWVAAQSLTSFEDNIIDHIITNTTWLVCFRISDAKTGEILEATTGKMTYRQFMTDMDIRETATGGRRQVARGATRVTLEPDFHVSADDFTRLEPRRAYVWSNVYEPSARTQWWRRGRVTFNEPGPGSQGFVRDIPTVYCIPADALTTTPDPNTRPAAITEVTVQPDQPMTRPQQNTLHMLAEWVSRDDINTALSAVDADRFADLNQLGATTVITALMTAYMSRLRRALGDDRYLTEYNKVARLYRKPVLVDTDTSAFDRSYTSLPPKALVTLRAQVAPLLAANPHHDEPPQPPIDDDTTHHNDPSTTSEQPAADLPLTAPNHTHSHAPTPQPAAHPAARRSPGFADDDESPEPVPETTTPPAPAAVTSGFADDNEPEPDTPTTPQSEATVTAPRPVDDSDADNPETADNRTARHPRWANDEERRAAVRRLAYQLLTYEPAQFGAPALADGQRYGSGRKGTIMPPNQEVWEAVCAHASQQLPPLH